MIGQTAGKGFFHGRCRSGQPLCHGARAELGGEQGSILNRGKYTLLNQWVIYSFPKARTGFAAMPVDNALKHIRERGSDYLVYDKSKPGEDMASPVFEALQNTFEKEVKEDPGRHKDTLEYRGYSPSSS